MLIAKEWDPNFKGRVPPINEPDYPTPVLMHWYDDPDKAWGTHEQPYFDLLKKESKARKQELRKKIEDRRAAIQEYRREEGGFLVRIPWLGYKAVRIDATIKPTAATLEKIAKQAEEAIEGDRLQKELVQGNLALSVLTSPVDEGGWGMDEKEARAHLRKHGRLGDVTTTQDVKRIELDEGANGVLAAFFKKLFP